MQHVGALTRVALALAVLSAVACEPSDPATLRRDAARPDRDGGAGDGGDDDRFAEHPCDRFAGDLEGLVATAAEYAEATDDPDARRLAATIVEAERLRHIARLVIDDLEAVLEDPASPVHGAPGGAAFVAEHIANRRADVVDLEATMMAAREQAAAAGFEQLADEDGPGFVIDAVLWSEIGARARDLAARCEDDRDAVGDEEVEELIADVGVMRHDLTHGHGVARQATIQWVRRGGSAP